MKPESAHTQLSTQEAYVKEHKRYHNKITLCRLTIFLLFLTVWELAADLKRIDAFFFSSPSRVLTCLLELVTEKISFSTSASHSMKPLSAFYLYFIRYADCHPALVLGGHLRNPRAVSGCLKQPAEIRTCSSFYRMAGHRQSYHRGCGYLRCRVRLHHQPVYRF